MIAISMEEWRARFPQFDAISDSLVAVAIEDAECETSESKFGDQWKRAVAFLSAHFVATQYAADGTSKGNSPLLGPAIQTKVKNVTQTFRMQSLGGVDGFKSVDETLGSTRYGQDFLRIRNACVNGFGTAGARG